MSIFHNATMQCPLCGAGTEVKVVASVNADRRPDLRDAVLAGTFQAYTCGSCGEAFRLQPSFTYIDAGRRQWILAHPADDVAQWPELETEAKTIFNEAFGPDTPRIVRDLGVQMEPRITFGWPALREKLVAKDAGISDSDLELLKVAILRQIPDAPVADETELRLDRIEDGSLIFSWLVSETESVVNTLRLPVQTLGEITAAPEDYAPLRTALGSGMFVDLNRALVPGG